MSKVIIYIKSLTLWYRKPSGRDIEIIAMGDREHQANKPFLFNMKHGDMNKLKLKHHSEGPHQSVPDRDLELNDVDTCPICKSETTPIDSHFQIKLSFLQRNLTE